MKINIAGGNSLMGKVHRPVFEAAGHEVIFSGRKSTPSLEEAAKQADITIISVPINVTEEVIKNLAPYCPGALMDFTSVKIFPVKAMLKYSQSSCEVAGLHPLYGDVSSIKGRTIAYCPTEKSHEKCEEIIRCFKSAGANIETLTPEKHDYTINGILQNVRVKLLKSYASLIAESELTIQQAYALSPPPTRIILDLIARQIDEKNDELYESMAEKNIFTKKLETYIIDSLELPLSSAELREFFGEELIPAQERAKNLIK
jgi:prephenate dehydrogenase